MKVYCSFQVSADGAHVINICDELNLNSGVKKICIGASIDGVHGDNADFAMAVPNSNNNMAHYEFPIIDGKSPCKFKFRNTSTSVARVFLYVEELGGEADSKYFEV